ncbi:alpha/beta hydrolase [Streptomyces canus]|uniref:alpha/beta hydrolase n=1 Tax=Streptomyces canus TaxID=58343 RepID=UPI0036E60332
MKLRLVFVHGIGGPRRPSVELGAWLEALGVGAGLAGHTRHISDVVEGRTVDARFAYYWDVFALGRAQGPSTPAGDEGEREDALVRELLQEAIDERLTESTGSDETRLLHHARSQLVPLGTPQGLGSVARQVLGAANTLLSLPGLRTFGGWASASLMVGHLRQVARYLSRGEPDAAGLTLDARIRRCVERELDPSGPTIVVAHSLGTVVALEALQSYDGTVPLLVTLGSPMGMRTAVRDRMHPRPLRVPDRVETWLNFWDRDDLVVGRPLSEKSVRPNASSVVPSTRRIDSDGAWVHPSVKYLAHPGVAGPVFEAIAANGTAVQP